MGFPWFPAIPAVVPARLEHHARHADLPSVLEPQPVIEAGELHEAAEPGALEFGAQAHVGVLDAL